MATATTIPVEQYLSTSYEPDAEFVDGVVEERNLGELDHATWQQAIELWFDQHKIEWNIRVRCEYRVQVSPTRYRVPDVVVWDRSRAKERILTYPPIAVFEVMSPEDTHARLMRKLADYEKMGIANIFVVEPEGHGVFQYSKGGLMVSQPRVVLANVGWVDWEAISDLRDE
jgi:Uma2 family endonuclease